MAAAPTPKRTTCCSPAVPPPPVIGAAVGVTVAGGVTVTVTVTCGVTVWVAGTLEGTLDPGVVPPSEPDAVTVVVVVAEMVTEGEPGTVGFEDEPEQAETATGTSRSGRPSQEPSPRGEPSPRDRHAQLHRPSSRGRLMSSVFPVKASETGIGRKTRTADARRPRRRGQASGNRRPLRRPGPTQQAVTRSRARRSE